MPKTTSVVTILQESTPARLARRFVLTGPLLFIALNTVQAVLRPKFRPAEQFVSELSLGADGDVQVLNFVLSGTMTTALGLSMWKRGIGVGRAVAGPVTAMGVALLASGPLRTDSSDGEARTVHGAMHGMFGAAYFSLAPLTCFIAARRAPNAEAAGRAKLTGVALVCWIVLLKLAQMRGGRLFRVRGIVQRVTLALIAVWITRLAQYAAARSSS